MAAPPGDFFKDWKMAQNEAQKMQEQMGLSRTIKLVQPVSTPEGEVTELTVRRVLVKDYRKAAEKYPNNGALQQIEVLAAASGLMVEDFENLCWEDYSRLQQFCTGAD